MDRSGSSFPPEEPFEDPEGLGEDMEPIPGDDFGAELDDLISDEGAIRGWIPPDDRLWVHPSEMGRESRIQDLDGARRRARRSDRRGLFAAGVVGTAALTAAVAAVALAASSSGPLAAKSSLFAHPTYLTNPATNSTLSSDVKQAAAQVCPASMPPRMCKMVERVQSSMLRIVVQNGRNTTSGTAVVVPIAGETVAITAASLVGSAATVEGFDASGRSRKLEVIGADTQSGIAVVKVPWAMPAASIGQDSLFAGQVLLLTCVGGSSESPTSMFGQVDDPATSAKPLMDVIDVDVTPSATPGGLLLDSKGNMVGLLAATNDGSGDVTGEFVPAWFAVGVARKIVTGSVVHGWLGVEGTNAADGEAGALVVKAPAQEPAAAAGVRPGDLVVGLLSDGVMDPILSMSDLEARLYIEPPGAKVELRVFRGGEELTPSPVLAASLPSLPALP
jgi:serine protease Do